jgi:hypothetical protein
LNHDQIVLGSEIQCDVTLKIMKKNQRHQRRRFIVRRNTNSTNFSGRLLSFQNAILFGSEGLEETEEIPQLEKTVWCNASWESVRESSRNVSFGPMSHLGLVPSRGVPPRPSRGNRTRVTAGIENLPIFSRSKTDYRIETITRSVQNSSWQLTRNIPISLAQAARF